MGLAQKPSLCTSGLELSKLALLRTVKWVTKRGHSRSFYSPLSISILSRARSSAEQAGKPRNVPLGGLVYSILLNFGSSVVYKQEAGAKKMPWPGSQAPGPHIRKRTQLVDTRKETPKNRGKPGLSHQVQKEHWGKEATVYIYSPRKCWAWKKGGKRH